LRRNHRRQQQLFHKPDSFDLCSAISRFSPKSNHRRHFIGGSDARIIVGDDEEALLRLWREKRGEVEPKDLSGNLIVQLGVVTEDLNRR
jgi:predicted phage-related endonuclease